MTTQRKILGVILGLGLLWLGVEQFIIGADAAGPSSAQAAPVDRSPPVASTSRVAVAPLTADIADDKPTLSDQLEQIVQQRGLALSDVREAFLPSPQWIGERATPAKPKALRVGVAERFKQKHRLIAVIINGQNSRAVVDDKTLKLGQRLDGFQLVGVKQRAVVFQSDETRIELRIDTALSSQPSQP